MKRLAALFVCFALPLFGQTNTGELRLKVTDPTGIGVRAAVQVISEANQYHHTFTTTDEGSLTLQRLAYGIYQVEIRRPGFAVASASVEIRSHPRLPFPKNLLAANSAVEGVIGVEIPTRLDNAVRRGTAAFREIAEGFLRKLFPFFIGEHYEASLATGSRGVIRFNSPTDDMDCFH